MEAHLNLPPLPVYLRGWAMTAQQRLEHAGRWRHFSHDGKHSLCSHVRAIGKVMDAIPEAMAPLDRTVPVISPLPPCLINMEDSTVAAEKVTSLALNNYSCLTDGSKRENGLSGSEYVIIILSGS